MKKTSTFMLPQDFEGVPLWVPKTNLGWLRILLGCLNHQLPCVNHTLKSLKFNVITIAVFV
jgi:hypothetical protein